MLPYRRWANWVLSIAEDPDAEDRQLLNDILRDYGDFMRPLAPGEPPLLVVDAAGLVSGRGLVVASEMAADSS